ncbi:MAG: tyrosine-type recombinase/integrase [Sulfuricella sp.]
MNRYLTEDEQRLLLSTVKQFADVYATRDFAWMRLLINSGLRIGEFSKVTVGDGIQALKTGYLFIPKNRRKGKPESRRDHSVLVTQPVREALLDLLGLRDGAELDEALVISRKSGSRGWAGLSVRAFEQRTAYWAKLAQLPAGVSPHWFRHTRAMNIMHNTTSKDPRGVVQATLGQASISSTSVYTGITKEDLESALHEVDGKKVFRKRDMRRVYEGRAS